MRKSVWCAGALALFLLFGCRQASPQPGSGVAPPAGASQAAQVERWTSYTEERHGYTVSYPEGWRLGAGDASGNRLSVASRGFMDVKFPGMRVLVTDYLPERGQKPPTVDQLDLVGEGNWPFMSEVTKRDLTEVPTATGPATGYLLTGGGQEKGTTYKALGLFVFGSGHEIRVICSSPADEWSKWEAVCQKVITTFRAGDLNKVVRPLAGVPAGA